MASLVYLLRHSLGGGAYTAAVSVSIHVSRPVSLSHTHFTMYMAAVLVVSS